MDPKLADLETRLSRAIAQLTSAETQARPPGHWSIQQIVEHLALTYASTSLILRDRLEKGRPTRASRSVRQLCGQLMIVRLGYFPSGHPAPKAVRPPDHSQEFSGAELLSRTGEELRRMDSLIDDVSSRFGERSGSVSHMILGPLSPAHWRRFHLVHGTHHIRQINEIRRKMLEG